MRIHGIAVCLFALMPALAHAQSTQWPVCVGPVRTTCVVDGDTFWQARVKYRLNGIDAPEAGDSAHCPAERMKAQAATQRLRQLLSGGNVTLLVIGNDQYGRRLVDVQAAGFDVGAVLVEEGFARPYRRGQKRDGTAWCGL